MKFSWSISAKWASKHLDCCTKEGIKRCKGVCCTYKGFWPPNVGGESCKFITPKGCSLDVNNRPVVCLLYPFRLNKDNKLVLHHRIQLKYSKCFPNLGEGPMAIVAVHNCFNALFGKEVVDKMIESVKRGCNLNFEVPENVVLAYMDEHRRERVCEQPSKRGELDYVMLRKKYKNIYEGQEVFF